MTVATSSTPTAGRRPGILSLLRLRSAQLFFSALTLAFIGANMLVLVGGVWVKTLTGDSGAAGLVTFFVSIPAVFYPFFGLLADRIRRRTIMVVANAVAAAVTPVLLLVHDASQVWLVYLVTFVYGAALAVMTVAESGLFVTMLPESLLGAANSLLQCIQESMKVLAPALGVSLFAWIGGGPVAAVAALASGLACVLFRLLRVDERAEPTAEPADPHGVSAGHGILAGFRHLLRAAGLRRVVLGSAVALLALGFTQTALFGVVEDGLHRQPAYLGFLVGVQGVGSILISLVAVQLIHRLGEVRFVALAMVANAVGVALLVAPTLLLILPGMFLQGMGVPCLLIGALTLMQRQTPEPLQGRTAAAVSMMIFVPLAVSRLAGAVLEELTGYRFLLWSTAAASAAVGCWLMAAGSPRGRATAPSATAHTSPEGKAHHE
ncbi:MFS transporter [Streptomyces sp. NPDC050759]|uniref:MFS transporter n=1 Tax=Streptomyces sp. NPDC050759 TaxID=3365635 RepID=UPI00379C2E13